MLMTAPRGEAAWCQGGGEGVHPYTASNVIPRVIGHLRNLSGVLCSGEMKEGVGFVNHFL